MKKYLILFFLTTLLTGCATQRPTPGELVTEYYEAFNFSDYSRITTVIADSITIVEGEYVMPYSQESFYEQFKWDSVFQPTYEILEVENQNNQIIATVVSSSKRYRFLKNDPLTCQFRISFNSNKITKLEAIDFLDTDWEVWQTERDSLVNWTSRNHPELDGFIHDLTMKGAINYLKAIELYENRKDAL
jgi:PBP1b-binding outer membrane lipoprotein LpoB